VSHQAFAGIVANVAATPYRNLGNEIAPDTDIPAQGKTNPQFEFGDHVIRLAQRPGLRSGDP